jgi:hypothetical protein
MGEGDGLHSGAVHEAGHAVMARLLKLRLGPIVIALADPNGDAHAPVEPTNAENTARIAAAGDACLRAFGIDTRHRQGAFGDEVMIQNALEELCDDEAEHPRRRLEMIAEVEELFTRPDVRRAVLALVQALMREGRIEGNEAQAIIDRHLADHSPELGSKSPDA